MIGLDHIPLWSNVCLHVFVDWHTIKKILMPEFSCTINVCNGNITQNKVYTFGKHE